MKLLLTLCCSIMVLAASARQMDDFGHTNVVYCSSSDGNDTNNGTYSNPVKTIARATELGDYVLLKRGDTFYEEVVFRFKSMGAYGGGNAPVVSGLMWTDDVNTNYKRGTVLNGKWQQNPTGNVWRVRLKGAMTGGGFNPGSESSTLYNIGGIVDLETGCLLNSRKCWYLSELGSTLLSKYFYCWQQQDVDDNGKLLASNFDYIYIYYTGDLRKRRIGFTAGASGVRFYGGGLYGVSVENWGRHGIEVAFDNVVDDCDIDNIGGMYASNNVCLGNGIECYVTPEKRRNITVRNCRVSHCYDCGMTVQGSNSTSALSPSNIIFTNNVIRNCAQGFEEFLRGPQDTDVFTNCLVIGNTFINNGFDTGFNHYPEGEGYKVMCHILSNSTKRPSKLVFERNTLINGHFVYFPKISGTRTATLIMRDNIVYLTTNQRVLIDGYYSYGDTTEPIDTQISNYRQLTGDTSTHFIPYPSSSELLDDFAKSFSPFAPMIHSQP